MNLIQQLINFLRPYSNLDKLRKDNHEISKSLANCTTDKWIHLNVIKELKEKLKPNQYAEYWNTNKPFADVTYTGRYLPFTKKKIAVPVQLFVTPNDTEIINDIKKVKLFVKNPMKCNSDILKIYKHTRVKPSNPYRYVKDIVNVGVPEFWYFPFELRSAKRGDCDDYAKELASYLIAAGIPDFRVRCVTGNCNVGGGHDTVYVLGDDMRTWYHLNSTSSYLQIHKKKSLTEFPTSKDSTDKLGIKDVWFSYNHIHAWHDFDTKEAETSFKKEKKLKIKIQH